MVDFCGDVGESFVTKRTLVLILFHSGVVWSVLFTTGFVEFTSGAAVLSFIGAGVGSLGVWSSRRRYPTTGTSWIDRHDRYLLATAHILLLIFSVRVGAHLAEDLVSTGSSSHYSLWWIVVTTVAVYGVSRAPRLIFVGVLTAASVVVAVVIGWVGWSVVSQGGVNGNHLATITGQGSSLAMIFRGVAVAAVSFTLIDSVMVRWRGHDAQKVSVFRPTLIAITLAVATLAYVMVTAAGSMASHIPYLFPAIAEHYSGVSLSRWAEAVPVLLLMTSAAILWRGFQLTTDSPLLRRGVAVAVTAGVLIPYPEMEVLQIAASLVVVSWLVVTARTLLRVAENREPWYEWIPPTCGAAVSALGLYGVIEEHLSLDQRSGSHHLAQLVVLLGVVAAMEAFTSRWKRGGQRPRSVSLGNEGEFE